MKFAALPEARAASTTGRACGKSSLFITASAKSCRLAKLTASSAVTAKVTA
jgi:hypothetical protein